MSRYNDDNAVGGGQIWSPCERGEIDALVREGLRCLGVRGVKGVSAEKEGIPKDKGAPRTIQASDLYGKPKEIKTIAGYSPNSAYNAEMETGRFQVTSYKGKNRESPV